jgi:hypothetical protein
MLRKWRLYVVHVDSRLGVTQLPEGRWVEDSAPVSLDRITGCHTSGMIWLFRYLKFHGFS